MCMQAMRNEGAWRVVAVLAVAVLAMVLAGCERPDPLTGPQFGEVEGQQAIVFDTGEVLIIDDDRFRGIVGPITVRETAVHIRGWAVNVEAREGATEVLLFSGDELIGRAAPDIDREAVATHLDMELVQPVGFRILVSRDVIEGLEQPLEAYAIHSREGEGFAAKLHMPERSRCLLEKLPVDSAECD